MTGFSQRHQHRLKIVGLVILLLSGGLLVSRTDLLSAPSTPSVEEAGISTDDHIVGGLGSFEFSGAEAVKQNPIRVWYIAPAHDIATARVLIVMPGARRDAKSYRDDWIPLVRDRHVLVIVPEFPDDLYDSDAYNLGNLADSSGDFRPKEQWSFTVIESLFDSVKQNTHSQAEDFNMFGHSAGAQFVHRFVEFTGGDRVHRAVAANAGWYTVPDDDIDFPYGLDGSPLSEDEMAPAFATNMRVMLGADDIDTNDELLRHDDGADEQGSTRLERGLNFYLKAREAADDQSLPFDWSLQTVVGVAHDHSEMAKAASSFLIDVP